MTKSPLSRSVISVTPTKVAKVSVEVFMTVLLPVESSSIVKSSKVSRLMSSFPPLQKRARNFREKVLELEKF